jgi:uncharacterized protein (DUF433 family)
MDEMLAFTVDDMQRLTGLSERQLRYWDKTGFFSPQVAEDDLRRPFSRIYSFRDIVGLRTIAELRERVPLQELRRIGKWLHERHDTPWASLRFYLVGRRVFFDDPETDTPTATRPAGQAAFKKTVFDLEPIVHNMREASKRLREREPSQIGKVTRHRYVMSNTPVLSGTRIPTSAIWHFHRAGYSVDMILQQYPRLTREDVVAAIAHEESLQRKRAG